uniref:Ran-binding protein 3 n=1 Tax=Oryzias sinensis TaxID=183150 RepID=A0A8C7Z6W4_9TELE
MTSLPLFLTDKPAIAPPVFVFQKDKAQKRSAEGSSAEDGEDSDKDEGSYCPPVKRERTSSFPPPHSEEKPVGFRLKPPTLIHGQAPSSGVPSQKPKEQQRSVLRPAVLQAPPSKSHIESSEYILHFDCIKHFFFIQQLDNSSTEENSKDSLLPDCQSESTNYFLQYISTPSSKNASNSGESGAKFVFGQNMSERVLSPPKGEASSEESKDVCAAPASESPSQETSLEESAAAYTKATAKKCVLEKVDVKTGEESESNVLQMQCKLYVFEKKAQSWIERGRGLLRLNDMASTEDGALQSRLVMRTQGSLRLILNTKLWPQMQVDKASEKSVRITAMDTEDQGVKVFLISGSSKDIGQLAAALHHRILALKSKAEQETEALTTTIPDAEVPQSNEDDSDEEDKASPAASAAAAGQGSVLHHLHLFGLSF